MECYLKEWCLEELQGFWKEVPDRCSMCNSRVRMVIKTLHYVRGITYDHPEDWIPEDLVDVDEPPKGI